MKELKRLSLKEEVDKETRQIEKEIQSREDLDDMKVSEETETSLFNKIQDYEYDRRTKIVRRKKKKVYVIAAVAAVFVLVFGSVMTSVGSKSYWKVLWEKMAGDERASHIDVDKMDSQETEDVDEIEVFKQISEELGVSTVRLGYMPSNMTLKNYELDTEQNRAILFYKYEGQVIKYTMYMNNTDSSFGQIEPDDLADEYHISHDKGIEIVVKEYEIDSLGSKRYIAEFEYKDAQYEIKGEIKKREFDKILKNLIFL